MTARSTTQTASTLVRNELKCWIRAGRIDRVIWNRNLTRGDGVIRQLLL